MGLRGEWWIDDSGTSTFADGDIGDQNHESIAFWSALEIDLEEITSSFRKERVLAEIQEYLNDHPEHAELDADEIWDSLEDIGVGALSEEQAIGLLAVGANQEAVEFFQGDVGGDARTFMMTKHAWIRVAGNRFQLWSLDDEALGHIRDFVLNEYSSFFLLEDEDPLADEFEIEELKPKGVHLSVSGSDLLESGKSADALKYSAQRERTGMYNPEPVKRTYLEIGHRGLKSKLWYGDEFNINVEDAIVAIDDKYDYRDPRNHHSDWALRMPWHGRYDPYSGEVSIIGGTMTEEWRQPSDRLLDLLRETFGADVQIVQFNPSSGNQEHTGIHNPPYDPKELKRGIKVEKEHTDDPMIAKQIAMDHLNEDPQYYSRLLACGITHNPPRRGSLSIPVIHPGCAVQVIEDYRDVNGELHSRWKTIDTCFDTPKAIGDVFRKHGLQSAWIRDAIGGRRMVTMKDLI